MVSDLKCGDYEYSYVDFHKNPPKLKASKPAVMEVWDDDVAKDIVLSIMQEEEPDLQHRVSSINDIDTGNKVEKLVIVDSEDLESSKESLFKFSHDRDKWFLSEKNIFPLDPTWSDWSYGFSLIEMNSKPLLRADMGKAGRILMQSTQIFEIQNGSINNLEEIFEYGYHSQAEVNFDFVSVENSYSDIHITGKWENGEEINEIYHFNGQEYIKTDPKK